MPKPNQARLGNTNRRKGDLPMVKVSWLLSAEDIEAVKQYKAKHDNMPISEIFSRAIKALLTTE